MEKIKTNLDRKPLSSDYIRSKQDFAKVLHGAKGLGKPFWKSTWFYGTVGVASVAVIVAVATLNQSSSKHDEANPEKRTKLVVKNTSDMGVTSEANSDIQTDNISTDDAEAGHQPNNELTVQGEIKEETKAPAVVDQVVEDKKTSEMPVPVRVREKTSEKNTEIGMPNLAGVSGGPISFPDFCDPLGIQVGGGVLIHRYTIQYRSCARDVTARVRGNRLPGQLCDEIRDCRSPIEVTFSNFYAEDRDGNPVQLKPFTLITSPR
jgi:hypothetical protein